MLRRVSLLLILSLCFQAFIFAEEKASLEDRVVGSTFKALAKAFVAVADIDKIKKNNIDKLNRMEEEKFRKRYAEVYRVIKDLPAELKVSYEITEGMTRGEAIRNIEPLDKRAIYGIINSIPDSIIAEQFRQYLSQKKQEIQKSSAVEQINKFWNKIIRKVSAAP